MLEDHAADFLETWSSPGHGVYGERGAESIHNIIRLLQSTYYSMQPAMIHLQGYAKRTLLSRPECHVTMRNFLMPL